MAAAAVEHEPAAQRVFTKRMQHSSFPPFSMQRLKRVGR
jgi:hypothetical protein